MSDRHTVDTITSDALDQLYARIVTLEAVCESNKRAYKGAVQAAWTAEARAERAEAERDMLGRETDRLRKDWVEMRDRAERAEAANERVRAIHHETCIVVQHSLTAFGCGMCNALDQQPTTGHRYLSTGCLHGEHAYCQGKTGKAGAKKPASCKWCPALCVCGCHQE